MNTPLKLNLPDTKSWMVDHSGYPCLKCGYPGYHLPRDELEVYDYMALSCNTWEAAQASIVRDAVVFPVLEGLNIS